MKTRRSKIWLVGVFAALIIISCVIGGAIPYTPSRNTELPANPIEVKDKAQPAETRVPEQVSMTGTKEDPFVHIPRHYWEEEIAPLLKEKQPVIDTTKFLKENSAPILDSIEKEYSKWMEEAEDSADQGYILSVKAKLTMAEWCVKDANIPEECKTIMLRDFSERAEAVMLKGYRNAASHELEDALYRAYGAYEPLTKDSLERFKFNCLKAGMEPDGKVERVEEILAASLAEREKLLEK